MVCCSHCTVWVSHHINGLIPMTLKHKCYHICHTNSICIVFGYDNCVILNSVCRIYVNSDSVCSVWIVKSKYYLVILHCQ